MAFASDLLAPADGEAPGFDPLFARTGAVLEEIDRLLDAWQLDDGATASACGELPTMPQEVLAATAPRDAKAEG